MRGPEGEIVGAWMTTPVAHRSDKECQVDWIFRIDNNLMAGQGVVEATARHRREAVECFVDGGWRRAADDGEVSNPLAVETLRMLGVLKGRSNSRESFESCCEATGIDIATMDDGDRLELERTFRAVGRLFAATLDPEAIAMVEADDAREMAIGFVDSLASEIWGGIDDTFTPGAPLRRLLSAYPEHKVLLADLWLADPTAVRAADVDVLAQAVKASLGPDSETGSAGRSRAFAVYLSKSREMLRDAAAKHPLIFHSLAPTTTEDCMTRLLAGLPFDWVPKEAREWEAVAEVAEAMRFAPALRVRPMALRDFVNARGRWVEYSARLRRAIGFEEGEFSRHLAGAVNDVVDVWTAFASQVIVPAALLSGRRSLAKTSKAREAARAVLFSECTLPVVLEVSRQWHARRFSMEDAIAVLTPHVDLDEKWPAGLPDWEVDGMRIKVLTRQSELSAEGRRGTNADGSIGLGHCVGGYAGVCRDGTSRVVSIRRLESGKWGRLSTAEISVKGKRFTVSQHKGSGNAVPSMECEAALAQYAAALNTGAAFVDRLGFQALRKPDSDMHDAGYDFRSPGAYEKACALWASFLPRGARRMSAAALAEFADVSWASSSPPAMGRLLEDAWA